MYDPDVIAYVYPTRGEGHTAAVDTINKYRASRMYIPPLVKAVRPSSATPAYNSRESTEEPSDEDDDEDGKGPSKRDGGLAIRFSTGARSGTGVVFGTGNKADIVTVQIPSVSRYHMAIAFDAQGRVIVRDLGSKCGTRVTYGDGPVTDRCKNFTWLLDGPSILGPSRTALVSLTAKLQFEIVVPYHDVNSPAHLARVKKFRAGNWGSSRLMASLALTQSGTATQNPSGTQTPNNTPPAILIRKQLGQGAFGIVTYVWNATTGEEYAIKEPLEKLISSGVVKLETWKKEARLLHRISHEHVVKFLGDETVPHHRLKLEYVPGGSLDSYRDLSTLENTQILCQLLSALDYLHALEPPIAHRDIKPANILVDYRRPSDNEIRVKFGDFGLARDAHGLSTVCGTMFYAAPEIFNKRIGKTAKSSVPFSRYDVAVDIYSLGVTVGSLEREMPPYEDSYSWSGLAWANAVRNHFESHASSNDLMAFLLDCMVVINTRDRMDTSDCHAAALPLLAKIQSQTGALAPRASSHQSQESTAGKVALEAAAVQQSANMNYHGSGSGARYAAQAQGRPVGALKFASPREEKTPRGNVELPMPAISGMLLRSGRVVKSAPER